MNKNAKFLPQCEQLYYFNLDKNGNNTCMICNKIFVMKKFNVERYFKRFHKEKIEKLSQTEKDDFFKSINLKFLGNNSLSSKCVFNLNRAHTKASFVLAHSIAKEMKPITDTTFFQSTLINILSCYGEQDN